MDPASAGYASLATALCRIVRLLVEQDVLREGDVTAAYREMSANLMNEPGGAQGVLLADMICNAAAGKPEGDTPS